ncbi:MAG: LpxD N-terminal domain-containing protein, partial [Undibacterium sp.]|nr:LpxD N-terminal domain-containing protein [Undibacterium sp.]
MTITGIRLGELVDRFGGQLIGSPETQIIGIAPLSDADERHATFLSNPKLRAQAELTRAAALILSELDHLQVGQGYSGARIITPEPYVYFARAAQYFAALKAIPATIGIHPQASVSPHAVVADSASIAAHVVIEAEAVIGENVVIG